MMTDFHNRCSRRRFEFRVSGFSLPLFVFPLLLATLGCQSSPSVRAVWSTNHRETISRVDQDFFLTDRASRIRAESRPLPAAEQGESFRVSWSGRNVTTVQMEYRQVNAPDKISILDFKTGNRHTTTFWIRGEDYLKAGPISAWRVTLWNGTEMLAAKTSALW
ncbi:MAG: hypothetical protein PCFJNLEI_01457 [Verrucomicrobiae bacterium]|nr:hypothetical protein [Verrucomicrobiae bacterium]